MGSPVEGSVQRAVLVVEDNADVREYLARSLALERYTVLQATSGREAMTFLAEWGSTICLVVSDFAMPWMNGLQLASNVAEGWPTVPFLMISGQPPPTWQGHFLAKPFSPTELLSVVQRLCPPPPGDDSVPD